MAALLGMGNPLLDITADVDAAFLAKYDLKPADAILADEGGKHKPLFEELVANPTVEYSAGGATQNSIRVCQWMLPDNPGSTAFFGSVGKDKNAEHMTDSCKKAGVNVNYHVDESTPTGTCAACVVDNDRSMVAALQAADLYKVEHLEANWSIVESAKIIYSAGFFVTHPGGAASVEKVSKYCNESGKTYCFNLGAPFILQVPPFRAVVDKAMPYVDILFGNETEAGVYAETSGWEEKDIPSIAKKLSLLPKEGKPRTVVITQGCDPACVAINGEVTEYPVLKLEKSQLKDTTGAGDSYVAGFLAGVVLGKEIADCARAGAYAASEIVQRSGCQFPEKPDFKW